MRTAVILALLLPAAANAQECLTFADARARWPKSHLYWHTVNHCWDNRIGAHYRPTQPKPRIIDPVPVRIGDLKDRRWLPRTFENATPIDPPVLIDPPGEPDECCWPEISQFSSRWGNFEP